MNTGIEPIAAILNFGLTDLTSREKALVKTLNVALESIIAVAELHSVDDAHCSHCGREYPCPTIDAINYPGGKK